jgi:hypothetical protein
LFKGIQKGDIHQLSLIHLDFRSSTRIERI